jgi:hypothetical protein
VRTDPRHGAEQPPVRLELRFPDDRRFAPLLRTACRIVARSLPGGERLLSSIEEAVADASMTAFRDDRTGRVGVELVAQRDELRVTIRTGDGSSELHWSVGQSGD